jgi:uncharacterized protein
MYDFMKLIKRTIQQAIETFLDKGKIIIVYGARRTGKTTLMKQILEERPDGRYINCDLLQYKSALETTNSELLKNFIGSSRLLILDEAQQILKIGQVLKIISDEFPAVQVIATGSSSFDLSGKLAEPLTGRSRVFQLFPLSLEELQQNYNHIEINAMLPNILRFGLYPEVFNLSETEAVEELQNIASNYLYKDILQLETVKRPDLVHRLLKALALQTGKECTYNELSQLLGENIHTVKKYIEILELSFVIFRLYSFSRNLRKEIAKGVKIFFIDPGIRNALIMNFSQPDHRIDTGSLWENFCMVERMKVLKNNRHFRNLYFWRTYDQQEIDLIEEYDGKTDVYEFKWNETKKVSTPAGFEKSYPGSQFKVINPSNYLSLIEVC